MAKISNTVKINGGIKISLHQCQFGVCAPVTTDTTANCTVPTDAAKTDTATRISELEARIAELEKINEGLRKDITGTKAVLEVERSLSKALRLDLEGTIKALNEERHISRGLRKDLEGSAVTNKRLRKSLEESTAANKRARDLIVQYADALDDAIGKLRRILKEA